MSLIINTFFTKGGNPALGLTPTIRIWEVTEIGETLVIGGPDPSLTETGDGFYKFVFLDGAGFDETKNYVIRVNGGNTLAPNERFSVASTDEEIISQNTIETIVDGVWDETATDHIAPGTTGLLQNQTAADAASIKIDMTTALSLVQTLIDYQENRTLINKAAKTLTIFADDGTTPIKVFDLKDGAGVPSILEVCERVPQ